VLSRISTFQPPPVLSWIPPSISFSTRSCTTFLQPAAAHSRASSRQRHACESAQCSAQLAPGRDLGARYEVRSRWCNKSYCRELASSHGQYV
jgi:hypothetical protein